MRLVSRLKTFLCDVTKEEKRAHKSANQIRLKAHVMRARAAVKFSPALFRVVLNIYGAIFRTVPKYECSEQTEL